MSLTLLHPVQSFRILQLGDIHLKADMTLTEYVDWKDSGFPAALGRSITPPSKLQASLRAAADLKFDALFICGDITDCGNREFYQRGVEMLVKLFDLANKKVNRGAVHSVPGNHDLPLPVQDTNSNTHLLDKFIPLEDIWIAQSAPFLAARSTREATLEKGAAKLGLFSLNSCIGCGEERLWPVEIRESLAEALRKTFAENGDGFQRDRLNTPAILHDHLDLIMTRISKLEPKSIAVILAHHNLLPQARPRLEVYTELLNAGLLRDRLGRCEVPVIYCHGHIHDDPVEIIHVPDGVKVVSIAAPLLENGFNVIEIETGTKGFPIGCKLLPYRWNRSGAVDLARGEIRRIPLMDSKRFHEIAHSRLTEVMRKLNKVSIYYAQFAPKVEKELEILDEELSAILLEAEWLGFVDIKDRDKLSSAWTIGRAIP